MTLRISLLGPAEIWRDNERLELAGHRPLALLAYLLIAGKPQSREHLVNLLFDRPDDPRASLRWTLLQLRKAIGAKAIHANRQEVVFDFESDYWLDVAAFEAGDLDQYRGELLEGLYLRDAHQYDAWLLVERERLRAQYQTGLERRLRELEEAEDAAAIESTALRLLQLDNLREDWHRVLMSAYASQGKFEAAQAQYELCLQVLRDELGQSPAPQTVALAQAIEQQKAELYKVLAARSPLSLAPSRSTQQSEMEPSIPAPKQKVEPKSTELEKGRGWSLKRTGTVALIGMMVLAIVVMLGVINSRGSRQGLATAADLDDESPSSNLAGTTVTFGGVFDEDYLALYQESVRSFEEATGIDVEFVSYRSDFSFVLEDVIAAGAVPDIISFPQPGYLSEFVRQGLVIDVRTFLDDEFLREHYSEALLEAALVDDQMVGIWHLSSVKSLVWYPKAAFEEAGYEVPLTWDELVALSDQIAADGRTPWCIGLESGLASGWVGTDWLEDILLRTAPPESYDAWVTGELPFDSPEIRYAFEILATIWKEDTFVNGGTAAIVGEDTLDSLAPMFSRPPRCFLNKQASFAIASFPAELEYGKDYDFFYFPPIDEAFGRPVLGAGDIVAMFNDRPEVREVMRFFATAESTLPFLETGGFASPHRDMLFEWYASPFNLKLTQLLYEADTYRFDASDMMPGAVGTGSFWQGIVDWAEGEELDVVLRRIDESWPGRE